MRLPPAICWLPVRLLVPQNSVLAPAVACKRAYLSATSMRRVTNSQTGTRLLSDGPAHRNLNALSLHLRKSSISGVDGVRLRPMAQMSQFTVEASWRVSIQQLRCAAEFRQIAEERAEDGFGKGSSARTLAHAALTLSNADRCVAFSPLYSVELARLRVHAFVDCGLG